MDRSVPKSRQYVILEEVAIGPECRGTEIFLLERQSLSDEITEGGRSAVVAPRLSFGHVFIERFLGLGFVPSDGSA